MCACKFTEPIATGWEGQVATATRLLPHWKEIVRMHRTTRNPPNRVLSLKKQLGSGLLAYSGLDVTAARFKSQDYGFEDEDQGGISQTPSPA